MSKFIVTANTYSGGYGVEVTLFGIFDTKEEAIKSILDEPVRHFNSLYGEDSFDFFRYYERGKTEKIFAENEFGKTRKYVGERTLSKEEFVEKHFIQEFTGEPLYIDWYVE